MVTFIAHIREQTEEIQCLEDHLRNTAQLAETRCSKIGLENVGKYIGLLHDLGKATKTFNDYIQGISDAKRGDIDHSTAGAQYIIDTTISGGQLGPKLAAEQMMELVIASHHSGLIDCISTDGSNQFQHRMEKDNRLTSLDEAKRNIESSILAEADAIHGSAVESLVSLIMDIQCQSADLGDGGHFRMGLLARLVLSCLVDADHTDTASFEQRIIHKNEMTNWDAIILRYYDYISMFEGTDEISQIRLKVSEYCYKAASMDKGIFTLSVPTGGGKTLSSLRFALEHLKKHNMDRIIYVIPYTSIIDQNAAVVRKALEREGENIITEYHSNVDADSNKDDQENPWRYLSDSWNSPIIFTTMVQFMDTFFSSGTKCARRMHNLANSVIIFDEIQTLPIKLAYMFNEAVNFLTSWCGSTAVLCTATQPLLGKNEDYHSKYPLKTSVEIIKDKKELFESMKRVEVKFIDDTAWDADKIANFVSKKILDHKSILVITNTKSMAKDVHMKVSCLLGGNTIDIYHLSANMCAAHRVEVLEKIRKSLIDRSTVCISTQLIEAGVDIDFEVVIRCMAGIDSIAQAAGRCNRNGRMQRLGEVYVIRTNERISKLKDIYEGQRAAESVFREFPMDLLSMSAMSRYFETYFYDRRGEMSYLTDNSERSLFDMLSVNAASVKLFKQRNKRYPEIFLKQSFHEANKEFHVIDSMKGVIVPYNDRARNIISDLCSEKTMADKVNLLREAQKYAVNTFNFESFLKDGIIKEVAKDSNIFYIINGYYDCQYGAMKESKMETLFL